MLIHADLKPFKCDECNESFRTKQLLKRHQNQNHNPSYIAPGQIYKCPDCNRGFTRKINLVKHQANHPLQSVRAQVSLGEIKTVNGGKQSQAIFEKKSEDMKCKVVKLNIPVKTKFRKRSCKKCPGCLAENCGVCNSCKGMVRFGGKGILKQRCQKRKCRKAGLESEDQEACPVVNPREQKQSSTEIPGRKWIGLFQQVKKLSMEIDKNPKEVIKSLQPVTSLKVDLSPEDGIKTFRRMESGGEQSGGLEVIHMVQNEDEISLPPLFSPLVTLFGEGDENGKDIKTESMSGLSEYEKMRFLNIR